MLARIAVLVALLSVICSRQVDAEEYPVLTYHGDSSRSGNFVVPRLTWEKARSIHLDQTFDARVSGHLYAQPLYWRVPGTDNAGMLLVATEDNIVQALDARSGKELWRRRSRQSNSTLLSGVRQHQSARYHRYACHRPIECGRFILTRPSRDSGGPHHQVFGLSPSDGSILQGWPINIGKSLERKARTSIRVTKISAALSPYSGRQAIRTFWRTFR